MLNSKVKWLLFLITGKTDNCELVVWLFVRERLIKRLISVFLAKKTVTE